MKKHNCEKCSFRGRYDADPKSILGRLWRWHINWCPGWRGYMKAVDDEKRQELIERYGISRD